MIKIETLDSRLMDLACIYRECKAVTREITSSYPSHISIQSERLERQIAVADMIIGGLMQSLSDNKTSLVSACYELNKKPQVVK